MGLSGRLHEGDIKMGFYVCQLRLSAPLYKTLEEARDHPEKREVATIIDKTVGKDSTFDVSIAFLPSPLFNIQCCAKLNGFSGQLVCYLPTLNRGKGGCIREGETISFAL